MGLKSDGSVVLWGCGTGCELPSPNTGFVAIGTHHTHALALRADGSIVAWGNESWGLSDVPAPNTGFVAVAAEALRSRATDEAEPDAQQGGAAPG